MNQRNVRRGISLFRQRVDSRLGQLGCWVVRIWCPFDTTALTMATSCRFTFPAQLTHHPETIDLWPNFRYAAIAQPINHRGVLLDIASCGRKAGEVRSVDRVHCPTNDDAITRFDQILHIKMESAKALMQCPHSSLDRFGPDLVAVWLMHDDIRRREFVNDLFVPCRVQCLVV
jgi:hypothetical protein